ncbi:MAG: alpha/beta hydrolase family protein [Phycisphaerales bacterium]
MNLMRFDHAPSRALATTTEFHWVSSGDDRLATSIDRPVDLDATPVVVLVHGFSGHRIGRSYHFVELGRTLAAHGVACVRFDQAGCGESSGDQTKYGLASIRRDCLSIYDWIMQDDRFEHDRFAIIGSSQGSLGAIMLDAEHPSAGVALWAPVFDLPRLVRGKMEAMDVEAIRAEFGFAPYRGVRLGGEYFDQLDLVNPRDLIGARQSPMFIVHSREDPVVPFDDGAEFAKTCREVGRACEFAPLEADAHDFFEEPLRSKVIGLTTRWISKRLRLSRPH